MMKGGNKKAVTTNLKMSATPTNESLGLLPPGPDPVHLLAS